MAEYLSVPDILSIKDAKTFELELKTSLKWNKDQWQAAGQQGTRFNKLCNSLQYWKSRLKPAMEDTSIVFTLFNLNADTRVQVWEIVEAIEKLNTSFTVQGYADFRNPRYICLYFKDKAVRDNVIESFKMFNDSFVVYLSWALECSEGAVNLKVHWLPMTTSFEKIKLALNKYVICVEEERKKLKFLSGREMPSGKVSFKVTLKKDILPELVPHVMNIGGMEALITISGRKPLCLNCNILGHVSKECEERFCSVCRVLKPKKHDCVVGKQSATFAEVVKNKALDYRENGDTDDWGASFSDTKVQKIEVEKSEIEQKINELEYKIRADQEQANTANQKILSVKRKVNNVEEEEVSGPDAEQITSESDLEIDWNMEEPNNLSTNSDGCRLPSNEDNNPDLLNLEVDKVKVTDKKKNKKRNRGYTSDSKEIQKEDLSMIKTQKPSPVLRSYGKPVPNNSRKLKEQAKFDKICGNREFIFKEEDTLQ